MNWTRLVKFIPLSLTLLLMLFTMIIMIYGVLGTSPTPLINVGDDGLDENRQAGLSAVPDLPDFPDFPGTKPASSGEGDFVTVQMTEADIYRGNLILINHNNSYEIPDEDNLVKIDELKTSSYMVADSTDGVLLLSGTVIEPLNEMMDAFYNETGCDTVAVVSAFRDYQHQREILDYYISIVGLVEAKKWAASPGHSEHHTGLAVDFGVFNDGALNTFYQTGVNEWFFLNSDRYGFIPRYPSNKTDITRTASEPWHFRYVGLPHAYFIRLSGLCFEEYIEFIRDFTRDKPFRGTFDGEEYKVYFTQDTDIPIPDGFEADISGNNIDGFIVTIKR